MTRGRSTFGKHDREQQKRAKAKAKAERRVARQSAEPEPGPEPASGATEAELMEQLGSVQRSLEAGEISLEEFEVRQEQIRSELLRVQR